MNTVLITGASGFVGTALSTKLLADGWRVRGTVRSIPPANETLKGIELCAIESLERHEDWSRTLQGVNTIVHLAARTHVTREYRKDPVDAYRRINVTATGSLARAAAAAGVRRFVFLSSVKVNGEGRTGAYSEADIPDPQDAYGITKWEAEQVLQGVASETGMDVTIIRPPLVYGPGVKANFYSLLRAVDKGIPLPFSLIRNRRSMIYLGNLVDAIVSCMKHPRAAGQIYLVSDGEDVSTPELTCRLADAFGRRPRLIPLPSGLFRLIGMLSGRSGAVDRLLSSLTVDTAKICQELGWRPPYTMDQGLRETVSWYRKRFDARAAVS